MKIRVIGYYRYKIFRGNRLLKRFEFGIGYFSRVDRSFIFGNRFVLRL